jgi:hypothetical protein
MKIKIVDWPHYHNADNSLVEVCGWQVEIVRHMYFFPDIIEVVDVVKFIIYKN